MKLIFLGPPGAGKGTQAAIISKRLGIPTVSTGDMLRAAIKEGTPTGVKAKAFMDEGKLVPDEIIIDIVGERLKESDCAGGYVLDGVPRTIAQAEALEKSGIEFDRVISLEVSDESIINRMSGRRTCSTCGATFHVENKPTKVEGICDVCGGELMIRPDDKPETVKDRLDIFHKQTEPLKAFYAQRGKLRRVAGEQEMDAVTSAIEEVLV